MEEERRTLKILTAKPTEMILQGKIRRRWEDNIRMYIKEIGVSTRNWVGTDQDMDYWRVLANAALNIRVPYSKELDTSSES